MTMTIETAEEICVVKDARGKGTLIPSTESCHTVGVCSVCVETEDQAKLSYGSMDEVAIFYLGCSRVLCNLHFTALHFTTVFSH